jgi:hypothetical protein
VICVQVCVDSNLFYVPVNSDAPMLPSQAASRIQVAFRTSSPTRASQSENLTAGKEYEGGVRKSGADSPLRASTTVIPARDANGVLVISESRRAQLTSQASGPPLLFRAVQQRALAMTAAELILSVAGVGVTD